jgi:hypothetical protein
VDDQAPQHAAEMVAALYTEEDRRVEKVLVRSVNEDIYAVQVWYGFEPDPESFFVNISELKSAASAAIAQRSPTESEQNSDG